MSILNQIATSVAIPVDAVTPGPKTMQDVYDDAIAARKNDEAKAINRLTDFFAEPLCDLPASVEWFDKFFALAKKLGHVPSLDRSFWRSVSAYNKWRNKVRRRIEHTIGEVEKKQERKSRQDGWAPLIDLLHVLSRDGGPVHAGEYGAVQSFADRARIAGIEPAQLSRDRIIQLLEAAPSEPLRGKVVRALKVLQRYQVIRSVAAHLPEKLEIDAARRRFENLLPPQIETWIEELLERARRDPENFDRTTDKYTNELAENTVDTYRSALRSYVWSSSLERSGQIDLEALQDFAKLFSEDVFWGVVAHWNDISEEEDGITARTASGYVSNVAAVASKNGYDVVHMGRAKEKSLFLQEGQEAGDRMAEKNIRFCRPLVDDRLKRRQFLTQHITYRSRAEDLLATDKVLSNAQLRHVRMFGTCAAFAAIELCGAPYRVTNTLQLRHRGPTSNLFPPRGKATHFQITLSAKEMKVKKKKRIPPVNIRQNRLEGAQTLEWYLKTIRPLFPYGNPDWCAGVDQPFDHLRFGKVLDLSTRSESIHFFVAPQSAAHLSKSLFYEWLAEASELIGMPLTPHNFRHGLASILLKRSLANLEKVANFLNNTPDVVRRNYAWINVEAVIEGVQGEILEEALG